MFQDLCYDDVSETNRFDLVVPGRKFPKWFSYQSAGASVTVQVPPNFENCLAIGLCAAFEHLPSGRLFRRGRHMLVCSIKFYPKDGLNRSIALKECISFPLPQKIDQFIPSHVWLIYLRREYFLKFKPRWHEILENKFDLKIDFKTEGTGLKVKKCGVHFVLKQDIDDLIKTNEMDFVSNGEGSFSDGAGPSGESSFKDCSAGSFSDEPGHSGEGSSNVMIGTRRKRNRNRIGSLMLRSGNWFGNLWR